VSNDNEWNEARRKLVRDTICPQGIPDAEFLLFMEQCQRSGLDPLIKQAFCVKRRMNLGTKERPNWVDRYEFQPSEAGMLARAERFPGHRGIMGAAVYEGDEILVDEGAGTVMHRYDPTKRSGKLIGAWARVSREGKDPLVRWLDFASRAQPTPLWGKDPAGMILKCSRVATLRTAYPEALGGLYVAGERPDDVDTGEDAETPAAVTREKPALPAPAPCEELTFSTAREKAPIPRMTLEEAQNAPPGSFPRGEAIITDLPPREPGSDDGDADAAENEALAIVCECETVAALDAYKVLAERGGRLPKGSEAKKRAVAALRRAHARLNPVPQGAA
jgi:phage recombination protein Bet